MEVDVEKVHAAVARSTFRSQNVQDTWVRTTSGRTDVVQPSKKCTLLWREAHFQVKCSKLQVLSQFLRCQLTNTTNCSNSTNNFNNCNYNNYNKDYNNYNTHNYNNFNNSLEQLQQLQHLIATTTNTTTTIKTTTLALHSAAPQLLLQL